MTEDSRSYLRNRAATLELRLIGAQAFALWTVLILVAGIWVMELARMIGEHGW